MRDLSDYSTGANICDDDDNYWHLMLASGQNDNLVQVTPLVDQSKGQINAVNMDG